MYLNYNMLLYMPVYELKVTQANKQQCHPLRLNISCTQAKIFSLENKIIFEKEMGEFSPFAQK